MLSVSLPPFFSLFFFFNDTATTEIYTLSLHDALPISEQQEIGGRLDGAPEEAQGGPKREDGRVVKTSPAKAPQALDRKSTRLNSSHGYISYAVFCLKKKKKNKSSATTALTSDQATSLR